jgi:beta-lactamase regulating signal transducer with metallopeptidase domain
VTLLLALPEVTGPIALLVRGTVLMGAAWAAAAALKKFGASAAARHMAWLLGVAALLALPVLWWLLPALRLPILPAEAAAAIPSPSFDLAGPVPPEMTVQAGWGMVLLMVYAVGAATLLLRLIVGRRMLRHLWLDAGALTDPAWDKLLSRLSGEMRLSRRVEVRISRGPAVPMTWGTLAPKVLLPAEASKWPLDRRRLVLLHELAHVARRDSLSRSAASLACALYWFHPGAWFAARRMRMEQEHAADDRVLMAGGAPQAYALSLLHLAGGPGAQPRFDQAAAMAGMYQLERRLVSITSAVRRKRPGGLFLSSSALVGSVTTLLTAAGLPVSASPTLPGPPEVKPTDMASVVQQYPGRTGDSSAIGAAKSSGLGGALQRFALDSPGKEPARKGREVETERTRETRTAPSENEPKYTAVAASRDRQQPAAQQLRDYDWELRRDSNVRIASDRPSSRQARLTLPTPPDSPSKEQGGRPKWARNVPRLVQSGTPARASLPTTRAPLVLSWSVDVGAK